MEDILLTLSLLQARVFLREKYSSAINVLVLVFALTFNQSRYK